MNTNARFVKRCARLTALDESGKQLNGVHVDVLLYVSGPDEFDVFIVDADKVQYKVQFSQLQFYHVVDFFEMYPNALAKIGSFSMSSLPGQVNGPAVVDFSGAEAMLIAEGGDTAAQGLFINGSCRLVGHAVNKTNFFNQIVIDVEKDGDIVEFENILFKPRVGHGHGKHSIHCHRGHIVFRACWFEYNKNGVIVSEEVSTANSVMFENCTFNCLSECGVAIDNGRVTFVKCSFSGNGIGIAVKEGGVANLHYSSFEHLVGGVVVPYKGKVTISNCTFQHLIDFAALASNGSSLELQKCTINQVQADGVVIEGGNKTYGSIVDCTFQKCRIGVRFGNGKVVGSVVRSSFRMCKVGTYVALDTVGTVIIAGCGNLLMVKELLILSGGKCPVEVDGVAIPAENQLNQLLDTREDMIAMDIKYGYPVSAMGKNLLQQAGIIDIVCAMCNFSAPAGITFKKCGDCREPRYCCQACQHAHWGKHFLQCGVLALKATKLATSGYVSCNMCGNVEVQCVKNEPYLCCSRCVSVVYCGKRCQKLDWIEHKHHCVTYRKSGEI